MCVLCTLIQCKDDLWHVPIHQTEKKMIIGCQIIIIHYLKQHGLCNAINNFQGRAKLDKCFWHQLANFILKRTILV